MTETTTNEPTRIQFIDYHKPALVDGDYEITVEQKITVQQEEGDKSFKIIRTFSVSGERFELKPTDIHAVFPPNGSLGEHSNCLPHIVLNRSTLPWERLPFKYPMFKVTEQSLNNLLEKVPKNVLEKLKDINIINREFFGEEEFLNILEKKITKDILSQHKSLILKYAIKNIPWLALLLFEEQEKPEPKIITLKALKDDNSLTAKFPSFELESGQHEDDKITVIDVKKPLLDKILPTKEDLKYLAHVRQGTDEQRNLVGDELAIIIGNRLPKKGSISTVHLVSVEGRYDANGFNFQKAKDNDDIRLVSLKSWSFACVDEKQSFKRLLTHLNRGQYLFSINDLNLISDLNAKKIDNLLRLFKPQEYHLSNSKIQVDEPGILWRIIAQDNQQYSIEKLGDRLDIYRREPSTLRLPKVDDLEAEEYLSMGYIPLPHFLRQGSKTFSWYHSPLMPGKNPTDNITLPISAADELVRYNPNNGIFDISYAAAWELGRLLALQNKGFSVSLYRWKRSQIQQRKQERIKQERIKQERIKQNQQIHAFEHLPLKKQPPISSKIPDDISSGFNNLSLLKGVPFNYLVPDEKMLPIESIRFFWIDPLWVKCLLDGAFSIGRVTTSDREDDCSHQQSPAVNPHELVTGFLLRSDVVSGWPGLLVDGYNTIIDNNNENSRELNQKLPLLRMDRLSANVLMCLFKGEVKTVDIHQKPETLHFGLDSNDGNNTFHKEVRKRDGSEPLTINLEDDLWKEKSKRVININELAKRIKDDINSAQFALEMIEDVEKVRFTAISDLSSQ